MTESPTTGIRCGNCKGRHSDVSAVRACYAGLLFPCHWLVVDVEGWHDPETGESEASEVVVECGAEAIATDTGWTCAAGHSHVTAEVRHAQGWDYAEDYNEALVLAGAGVEPRTLDGHAVTGVESFGRAA